MNWKELIIDFVVLIIPVLILGIFKGEVGTAIAVIAVVLLYWYFIDYKVGEWKIFLLGVIVGFIAEVGGDTIYQMQYWVQGSLFGIPLWLPLFWGLGFVMMRRIGNNILNVEDKIKTRGKK